jgi:hypothetical protein
MPPDVRRKRLAWAAVQFGLGQGQMLGAVVAVYLLVVTGPSEPTLAVAAIATSCFLASRLIFRGRSAAEMVDWQPSDR